MADNPELESLRNLVLIAQTIISSTKLPEGRSERATEVLSAALALVDDLLKTPAAAALGKKGGIKTAERGPDYFREIAAKRKTKGGGRPKKNTNGVE
jgi:hypothetical protein